MSLLTPKPVPETVIVVVGGPAPGDTVMAGLARAEAIEKRNPASAAVQRKSARGVDIVDTLRPWWSRSRTFVHENGRYDKP